MCHVGRVAKTHLTRAAERLHTSLLVDCCSISREDTDPDDETINAATGALEGSTAEVVEAEVPCLFSTEPSNETESASRSRLLAAFPLDADVQVGDVATVLTSTIAELVGRKLVLAAGPRHSLRVVQRWWCELAEEVR